MPSVTITVNGKPETREVENRTLLVQFLREHLRPDRHPCRLRHQPVRRLRRPCRRRSVKCCTMLAAQAEGRQRHHHRGPRQRRRSCIRCRRPSASIHGLQCGFCTPGMVMSAVDLVRRQRRTRPSATIREWLEGNICRCTGYHNIVKAIARRRRCDGAGLGECERMYNFDYHRPKSVADALEAVAGDRGRQASWPAA